VLINLSACYTGEKMKLAAEQAKQDPSRPTRYWPFFMWLQKLLLLRVTERRAKLVAVSPVFSRILVAPDRPCSARKVPHCFPISWRCRRRISHDPFESFLRRLDPALSQRPRKVSTSFCVILVEVIRRGRCKPSQETSSMSAHQPSQLLLLRPGRVTSGR